MKPKISGNNLYKIFGDDPSVALSLLSAGESKDQIYETTGQAVGVHDVTFKVVEGEIFVVMGLSGSGKSTLVRMINGLIKPSAGEILIDGMDVGNCSEEELRNIRREKVAMVFQHFALFPHKTVAENVAFGLKIRGVKPGERRERARAALEQLVSGRGQTVIPTSFPAACSSAWDWRVGWLRSLKSC